MDDAKNKKIFYALAAFALFNMFFFFFYKVVLEKVTDRVIQKLQKSYSPSPYGPGFDPDKINPNVFRPTAVSPVVEEPTDYQGISKATTSPDAWRDSWEESRGVKTH